MDNYFYFCQHCGKEYIPKRRYVQKYCSNSCRTNAFIKRNKSFGLTIPEKKLPRQNLSEKNNPAPAKIEKMSLAGIGNAAAGSVLIKLAENIFTNEVNKPATKGDIKNLEEKISKRYYQIRNLNKNEFGKTPFFDTSECLIIYLYVLE